MIPQSYITEWSNFVPWQSNEQIEQDLLICRSLVAIYSDEFLASSLAFRGGTALHKLYLKPQPRYSEDIDLVQIRAEPIKETIKKIQEQLNFVDTSSVVDPRKNNNTLRFRFDSEFPPIQRLKIKIEINCREHFTVLGYQKMPFEIKSSWYSGLSNITTYQLEELIGTKLRALYQRKKGRDLYDVYKALIQVQDLDKNAIVHCFRAYMKFVVGHIPTQKQFIQNLDAKMLDTEFLGDIIAIIRPEEIYNSSEAYELVRTELIEKL
jgi:predicted nucleotidyltransferase component of viral defense system